VPRAPKRLKETALTWILPEGCRGLIFDCDGTLVDSMPLHYQAWVEVLSRHGLELTEARFYEWAGTPIDVIIDRLATEKGLEIDAKAVGAERDAYFHSLPASELGPVDAVVDIARRFRGELPMAVATGSTTASASTSLRTIGILDWFDVLISSDDVSRPKPAPDIFLIAAQRICVPPGECVVFEDGEAGLQAARAAGMHDVDIRPWLQCQPGL
jgi:HAD superfamily hydrolase (TIGR01509 family)